ncbi:MAG: hypothetical protein ACT4PU_12315 [Planctomycetota bacterium]
MARFPGTETHGNRAGLRPGTAVRCRRSRANADLSLADRRGVVSEVRLDHARLLFGLACAADETAESAWVANEQLIVEPAPQDSELAILARVLTLLAAERVDFEEGELLVAGGEYDVAALDAVRALLGARLLALTLRPEGVHLLGTRLRIAALPR